VSDFSVVSDLQSNTIEYEHLRCGKKVRTVYFGLQILIFNGAGLRILLNNPAQRLQIMPENKKTTKIFLDEKDFFKLCKSNH
jgi:hypothetical protein